MKSESAIQGGCLCGKVQYEVTESLDHAHNCHCSMCRRQHGAAYATYADVSPDAFKWILGEDLTKTYESPAGAGWCFCTECGATLAGTQDGRVIFVTLGTIAGDPGVRPESHIFVGSKALWNEILDDLPQFEERSQRGPA